MIDIPYKSHIRNLLRVLNIVDINTLIDLNKCKLIKLFQRDEMSMSILVVNIVEKNENWWLFKYMKRIKS